LPKRAFRIGTLFMPSWFAWYVAFSAPHRGALTRAVTYALGPLWIVLAVALVGWAAFLAFGPMRKESALEKIDVLTASGSALAWCSSFAIMGAVWVGWASLAVVGLLGTGVFHVVVLMSLIAFRRGDPLRGASVERKFSADAVSEGDDVVEELRFTGLRIPIGFRLFVDGRVGPRWPTTRHVLEASESGDVVLESEIGPALRGEHDAQPLEIWLEDTFGLCRSIRRPVGAAKLTVLPGITKVDRAVPLVDHGIGPRASRTAARPTEGCLQLREYQQGDDVRRIHWVRSIAAGELIVRLPDELPPDRPRVRLVLDTFFPEAFGLSCDAPAELLDVVVRVWLGVGRALAESGVRVTLVTLVPRGEALVPIRHELSAMAPQPALRLAAGIAWQNRMPVTELLTDDATFVVSHAVLAVPPANEKRPGRVRWILVPPDLTTDTGWPFASSPRLPFPMGTPDNRWSRRRREREAFMRRRSDHATAMVAMRHHAAPPPAGSFAAIPNGDGVRLEVIS
jgi:uncharacterized protein (DUF58 family)